MFAEEKWTHAELVKRAARWLKNTKRCGVVLVEPRSFQEEIPDAIGWINMRSILVECKATRADFLSDAKKGFRRHADRGMGEFRYYMAPKGLIDPSELPDKWGLIEVSGRTAKVVTESHSRSSQEENHKRRIREFLVLYYALYGVQNGGKTSLERTGFEL